MERYWIFLNSDTMTVRCDRCGCCDKIPEGTTAEQGFPLINAFREIHKFCKEIAFSQ